MYIIFKFGGASIKNAEAIKNMATIVSQHKRKLLIVVSAIGKTTNKLEDILHKRINNQDFKTSLSECKNYHDEILNILFEPNHEVVSRVEELFEEMLNKLKKPYSNADQAYDAFVSYGEILSSTIIYHYLKTKNENTQWIDAKDYIKTDDNFRSANVKWELTEELVKLKIPEIINDGIAISQGFIGSDIKKRNTTLGREGSDFSAAIFAYTLKAKALTIWKDVPGIMNADPKLFPNTKLLHEISYKDASEMTFYGASVIHPKTIKPLVKRSIPLHVKPFLAPNERGTVISKTSQSEPIPCFMIKKNQVLISLKSKSLNLIGTQDLNLIFNKTAEANIKISLMQNSAISISICCDHNENQIQKFITSLKNKFEIHFNNALNLITIKNYDKESIEQVIQGREIILEQKNRKMFQILTP